MAAPFSRAGTEPRPYGRWGRRVVGPHTDVPCGVQVLGAPFHLLSPVPHSLKGKGDGFMEIVFAPAPGGLPAEQVAEEFITSLLRQGEDHE